MNRATEEKILAWCRAQKRPVGMREGANGDCLVRYLDTMGNSFISKWGMPVEPLRYDPEVVLAHGATWAEVATKLGLD